MHDFIKFRNQQCFQDNEDGYDAVDPQRNIDIFAQILEGAAYIHEQGVMHRDLKPTNIFLSMPSSLNEARRSSQSNRRHGRSRANSLATSSGPRSHGSISSSNSSSNHGMLSSSSLAHDHSFSFDSVHTPDGLRQCMWDEPWVPKIGDFGLAAASEEDQDLSSSPFVEEEHQSACENNNSSKEVSENTTPRRRPSVRRMRTGGVGTRTVSSFHSGAFIIQHPSLKLYYNSMHHQNNWPIDRVPMVKRWIFIHWPSSFLNYIDPLQLLWNVLKPLMLLSKEFSLMDLWSAILKR